MRRATIRTTHDDPDAIARAIAPDNTDEMTTTVERCEEQRSSSTRTQSDGAVVTRIERETTGGLHATVDDYVVNVDVAATVVQHAREANRPPDADASGPTDASASDTIHRSNDE